MKHGRTGYERRGCRCAMCRAANAAHVAAVRARRLLRLQARAPEQDEGHGTQGGYDAGCRCEACRLVRRMRYWNEEGGPRRHRWREQVVALYHDARLAWERVFEATTHHSYEPGLIAREKRRERLGGRREVTDFIETLPPPTLRTTLVGLSSLGYAGPIEPIGRSR